MKVEFKVNGIEVVATRTTGVEGPSHDPYAWTRWTSERFDIKESALSDDYTGTILGKPIRPRTGERDEFGQPDDGDQIEAGAIFGALAALEFLAECGALETGTEANDRRMQQWADDQLGDRSP